MNVYPFSAEQRLFWRAAQRTGACAGHVVSARIGSAIGAEDLHADLRSLLGACETYLLRPETLEGYDVPFLALGDAPALRFSTRSFRDHERMNCALSDFAHWPQDWGVSAIVASCEGQRWAWLAAPAYCLDLRSLLGILSGLSSSAHRSEEAQADADRDDPLQYLDYVVWQDERRTALLSERSASATRPPRTAAAALPLPCGRGEPTSGHVGVRIPHARLAPIAPSADRLRDAVHRHWSDYTDSIFGSRSDLYTIGRLPPAAQLEDLPGVFDIPLKEDENDEVALLLDEHAYLSAMTGATGFGWHAAAGPGVTLHATAGAGCDLLLSALDGPDDAMQLLLSWQNLAWSHADALAMLQQFARRLEATSSASASASAIASDAPPTFSLLDAIARQVRERGDSPAVRDAHVNWSYSELWRRSGALASSLAQRLSQDEVAAIWAPTEAEAVLAMLACLRAGRTYLPIDPQTPPERLEWLLRNSGASLLLAPSGAVPSMHVDAEIWTLDAPPDAATVAVADRGDDAAAAYLIYTSGSTGTPKGVAISPANLDHYIEWAIGTYFDQGPCDCAVFSSLAFDMVVTPIFASLASGGCLRLWPTSELERGLRESFASENRIGLVKLTPSHIDLVAALDIAASSVGTFIVGGEALHAHQVGVLERINPAARIFNEYGPTETTVGCLVKRVSAHDRRITIGAPISRCRALVVDESLAPVLPGDVGELLIAGAGVGIGYWRDSELTERSFIALPGSADRWYRTGDLVCELPNGEYDFRGRRDGQVKLRGHRIELGEIERVLLRHPRVRSAAVFLQTDPLPHLMACVESEAPASLAEELARFAAGALPAYMRPDRIVVRPSFPLNGNGKLDRERLLADCVATSAGGDFENARQRTMAELWAQALAIPMDTLAPDSHYQRLGGDSIRAIRLIAAVLKRFDVRLSIKQLYENPTIRELTVLCGTEAASADGASGSSPGAPAGASSTPVSARDAGASTIRFPAPENSLGMLWLSDKHADVHAYHIQNVYHTAIEEFDAERLASALRHVTHRHEALRSGFDLSDGEQPMQCVSAAVEPDLRIHDLLGMPRERQEASVAAQLQRDRERPFDIAAPGLWRMHVFLIEDGYQVLAWVHHHAILDGWSNAVLMRELVERYRAPSQTLPSNPARLSDYAEEQARIRRDESLKTYWRLQLDGVHPLTLIAHDRVRPGTARWERKQSLPDDVAQGVRALAEALGLSVRDICIGAFQRAVATVAFHARTFIGLVENNRPLVEGGDTLVGCFLNTIPLICPQGDRSWRESLIATGAQLRELKHHGRLPLSEIARLGDLGLNRAGAFQVMFSYVDFHVYAGQSLPQRRTDKIAVHSYENTSIPLAFTTSTTLGVFEISVHSWLDDAARRSADVLFDIYASSLSALAKNGLEAAPPRVPETALAASHRANLTRYAHEQVSLWRLLQRRLAAGGDRPALRFGEEVWSYDALAARTAQLADALQAHGVGNGDRVVLVLDRCLQLPALLYAILAVGASYVPVDPETPQIRLDAIVRQTAPRLIVADRSLAIEREAAPCRQLAALLAHPPRNRSILDFQGGGECAYIIFTSGTTGVPKGVVVGDRAIVNRLQWMQRAYPLAQDDVVLHKTPYAFDVSVWEFFWPIIAGCGMAVAAPGAHLSPPALSATIRDCGVSVVHFVPAMLAEFLPELRRQAHPSLRYVICSGEALPASLVEDFFKAAAGCRLENLYGPTEAAVDVTAWSCVPGHRDIPIGAPIDNIQMHVMNESLRILPDGCVGELCISGVGLADGYWGQDAMTRRVFVDHPDLGERIYRTGDLACWDQRGYLIYHGRIDHQVKLRGQRIELKDVEFHLGDCLGGRRCVAVVANPGTDRAYLAAFVESASAVDRDALFGALAERLPGYMIPRAIHTVDALPVTSNGKLDRSALMDRLRDSDDAPQDGPMSELERVLIECWRQLLQEPIASVSADLYARGVHSLLMIRALAMIRERLGLQIAPKRFLECATIREQAMLLAREQRTGLLLETLGERPAGDHDIELVL